MIEFKDKKYDSIFNMPLSIFKDYLDSQEGNKLIEDTAKLLEKKANTDPYFFAEECCAWNCKYNSGYNREIEMGEMTLCHKYRWKEENTCEEIEHYFG